MNTYEKYFNSIGSVQEPVRTFNEFNESITTWADFLQIEGKLRPLSGDKRIISEKESEVVTHKYYCTYVPKLDLIPAGSTFLLDGIRYKIKFVQNVMVMDRLIQMDLELVK